MMQVFIFAMCGALLVFMSGYTAGFNDGKRRK